MADYYTSAHLLRVERKGKSAWQGVLQFAAPNPAFVEDLRTPEQRRRAYGKKPNPEYVEDTRTPEQRRRTITKQKRKVFDPEAVKNKTQATAALAAWHAQMEKEHGTPDANMTVSEYVERYISDLERVYDPQATGTGGRNGIGPTTASDYRGTMRYFKRGKAIDGMTMRTLTVKKIEAWEMSLLASGLSGTTVAKCHRLLWSVCEDAVNKEDLQKNPARGVKTPNRTSGTRPNALDAEGRAKAMQALGAVDPTPLTVAARLALYCGLRRGECCALTWGNVDLRGIEWPDTDKAQPKIRIERSVGVADGGTYLKPPKSAAGRRVLTLEGGIIEVLEERRAAMWQEWCDALNRADIEPTERAFNDLYVCGRIDGTYYNPAMLTHEWAAFARQWGLRGTEGSYVNFHGLRDTYATNALNRGIDVGTISNNLGHSDPALTLRRYASARDSAAMAAANKAVAADLDAARMGTVLPFAPRATGTDN